MVLFARIVNGFQLLTIFARNFVLDVRMGSEYASENSSNFALLTVTPKFANLGCSLTQLLQDFITQLCTVK